MAVTAGGDALCFGVTQEELAMFDVLTDESWRHGVQIEERNAKPLRIALFAVVAAWSIGILIALV
jgi:hypothetical protein